MLELVSPSPTPEVARFDDSPAARVEWHLACIEARKAGTAPPPAPWETPAERTNGGVAHHGEPLSALTLPPRHTRAVKDTPPVTSKQPRERKTANYNDKPRSPRQLQQGSEPPVPQLQPRHHNGDTLPRPLSTPAVKPPTVSFLAEKHTLISSLLLRAGVPKDAIALDNRAQAVLDGLTTYLRDTVGQTLHKYNLGRQFLVRGSVREANQAAEIVLPLLMANTQAELRATLSQAERRIEREILAINIPGPRVEIPKRR